MAKRENTLTYSARYRSKKEIAAAMLPSHLPPSFVLTVLGDNLVLQGNEAHASFVALSISDNIVGI